MVYSVPGELSKKSSSVINDAPEAFIEMTEPAVQRLALPSVCVKLNSVTVVCVKYKCYQTYTECRVARGLGHDIDSISPRAAPAVRAYVRDQAVRHPLEAIAQH